MAKTMPCAQPTPRIAPLPEHREALVCLLVAPAPEWEALGTLILRDPGLLYPILAAAPLARQRLASTLRGELTRRLELLGADLLRCWLLQQSWNGPPGGTQSRALSAQALLVAECALHLALETRYPHPDEAYLAGLWHNLGALCVASEAPPGTSNGPGEAPGAAWHGSPPLRRDDRQVESGADLAARCGVAAPLADALAFDAPLDEHHLAAHPLVRLLWAAKSLARADWREATERVGAACGLAPEAVLSLRTDVGHLAAIGPERPPGVGMLAAAAPRAPVQTASQLASPGEAGEAGEAMRELVLAGLARGAFAGLDGGTAALRFAMACRLLCGEAPPLVVVADESEQLQALPLTDDDARDTVTWYGELAQRLDDETSVIALALRTRAATAWYRAVGATRSARDWHVARWLGRDGLVCLPLPLRRTTGVAVFGADESTVLAPAARRMLTDLASAAAAAVLDLRREEAARDEAGTRLEARFRAHARRIAHEAGNPLSVIKSHLELMAQRDPPGAATRNVLSILHDEIDRIAKLLQDAGHPPPEQPEPASCRVPEVLRELQTVYGEALFGNHGIRFELRVAEHLPPAAMPASALRQVLLNLYRNAAEALQPGRRFVVTVPGQVLANGVPCLELRLIDNGPGLPPERLADPFSTRASDKGEAHQGLGLSIVREILLQWHAFILCRSQPGSGTSFQLLIPLDKNG
jgi:hypothetical protein